MKLEVEQKFAVPDLGQLQTRLLELGAKAGEPQLQVDQYFAHPARDFAQTDEALRIRRIGQSNFVTYKGPKIDATTKTRRELELPLVLFGLGHGSGAHSVDEYLVIDADPPLHGLAAIEKGYVDFLFRFAAAKS